MSGLLIGIVVLIVLIVLVVIWWRSGSAAITPTTIGYLVAFPKLVGADGKYELDIGPIDLYAKTAGLSISSLAGAAPSKLMDVKGMQYSEANGVLTLTKDTGGGAGTIIITITPDDPSKPTVMTIGQNNASIVPNIAGQYSKGL